MSGLSKKIGRSFPQRPAEATDSPLVLPASSPRSYLNVTLLSFKAGVIAAAVLWIYGPTLRGEWLWDDDLLITNNATVKDPAGLWRIWFQPGSMMDYQPLKFSVVWLQWHLWGENTLGYHVTSIFLHLLSALLVWRLLHQVGLKFAWLGGLIFAVHPAQVESVAWISELKNTLSLPPFLLAMCAFINYEKDGKSRDYFLALGFFIVAMLCKITMAMFPLVILLYAWWKSGQIRYSDLRASAPFFAVSALLGVVTVFFQQHHSDFATAPAIGLLPRVALAGLVISFYISDFLWPVGLLLIYPPWQVTPLSPLSLAPLLLLGAVAWWC